jgi:hypothetical protein
LVAEVAAPAAASLVAWDAAQELAAVAALPVFPAAGLSDVAVPGAAAGLPVVAVQGAAAGTAAVQVAVAAVLAFPAARLADVAVPGVAAGAVAAAVLPDAGELAAFAAQVLQAWPDVPADLGAAGELAAPEERGASVALAAPVEPGAPVPGVPARLASVEESAVQSALLVPAFLLDPAAMADD